MGKIYKFIFIKNIGLSGFENCKCLMQINIHSFVTEITKSLFYDCSLIIIILDEVSFQLFYSLKYINIPDSLI